MLPKLGSVPQMPAQQPKSINISYTFSLASEGRFCGSEDLCLLACVLVVFM